MGIVTALLQSPFPLLPPPRGTPLFLLASTTPHASCRSSLEASGRSSLVLRRPQQGCDWGLPLCFCTQYSIPSPIQAHTTPMNVVTHNSCINVLMYLLLSSSAQKMPTL